MLKTVRRLQTICRTHSFLSRELARALERGTGNQLDCSKTIYVRRDRMCRSPRSMGYAPLSNYAHPGRSPIEHSLRHLYNAH